MKQLNLWPREVWFGRICVMNYVGRLSTWLNGVRGWGEKDAELVDRYIDRLSRRGINVA